MPDNTDLNSTSAGRAAICELIREGCKKGQREGGKNGQTVKGRKAKMAKQPRGGRRKWPENRHIWMGLRNSSIWPQPGLGTRTRKRNITDTDNFILMALNLFVKINKKFHRLIKVRIILEP
jgi:hypothetical protein